MECKNCNRPLRTEDLFCSFCGAKVIRNRLTFKNLWHDFSERYLSVDNTFLSTFKHLFSKPEEVIGGYINGVRKKYMNPISYFTIAVTFGGLFLFIYKKFFPNAMDFDFGFQEADSPQMKLAGEINNILFDYQNLFYISMLPILAIISRLVFINRKNFNLSEHFVITIYGYSQMSIIVNLLYIATIWNTPAFQFVATFNLVFQIGYFTYVFNKLFDLTIAQTLVKLLFFLLIFAFLFVALVVLIAIYMIFNSELLEQMKAAQQAAG